MRNRTQDLRQREEEQFYSQQGSYNPQGYRGNSGYDDRNEQWDEPQRNRQSQFSRSTQWDNGNSQWSNENYGRGSWQQGNNPDSQRSSYYDSYSDGQYHREPGNTRQNYPQENYSQYNRVGSNYGYRQGRGYENAGWQSDNMYENNQWSPWRQSSAGAYNSRQPEGYMPDYTRRGDAGYHSQSQYDRYGSQSLETTHKGRGPKGYTRSDERISEDVNDRLSDDGSTDATNIEVRVNEGTVILSGTVESREIKRRAEDIAESVSGVQDVENHLHVSHGRQQNENQKSSLIAASSNNSTSGSSERSKAKTNV